jgi:uncharacterized membrane protein YhaH (DUF805 family)
MNWYIGVLKKYAVFTGRARRTEYWMYTLFNIVILVVLGAIDGTFSGKGHVGVLYGIYALATLVPSLAVGVRRLHDTTRSGWWLLISLVPLVGGIILIVFLAQDSHPDNQYGPNPKGVV